MTTPATYTDQQLLELTRAHIAKILITGQSYTVDGRTLTHVNLDELTKLQTTLEGRIAAAASAASGKPARNLATFRRD